MSFIVVFGQIRALDVVALKDLFEDRRMAVDKVEVDVVRVGEEGPDLSFHRGEGGDMVRNRHAL